MGENDLLNGGTDLEFDFSDVEGLELEDDSAAGEFEEIGQTSEDLDIDLNAVADYSEELDVRNQPGFFYPAMLISGIKFSDALEVLQTAYHECRSLCDVWIDLEDGNPPVKQGRLPADLNTFLIIRYLGLRVTLYPMEGAVRTLNLSDPFELENFI